MRADDLAVCQGKALQLQVWLLFTELWAQSQGNLALSYTRLAMYPLVLPQGCAKCSCMMSRSSPFAVDCASHSCHFPQPLLSLALHVTPLGR